MLPHRQRWLIARCSSVSVVVLRPCSPRPSALLDFHIALTNDLAPANGFCRYMRGEVLWTPERKRQSLSFELGFKFGRCECLGRFGVEPLDNPPGRTGRCHKPEPGPALDTRYA